MTTAEIVLLILLVLVLGGAAAGGAWLIRGRGRLARRAESAEREAALARQERDAAARSETEVQGRCEALLEARDRERAALNEELSGARERVATLTTRLEEREAASKAEFERLREEFDKIAKASLEHQREQFEGAVVKPVDKKLAETHERLVRLAQQLEDTATQHDKLRGEYGNLVRALSRPEVRGHYGEMQLRRVVELSGMMAYCDFEEQVSGDNAEGARQRPDMVVRLPNDCSVIVDAKCNVEPYMEALRSEDDGERKRLLDRFADGIGRQAKSLSDKRYWDAFERTPEFVVMFVPGDQFLDAALQRKWSLIEEAASNNVILASPATLIGLLRAVAVGWRQDRLANHAQELLDLGRELHNRSATLFEHAERMGKNLDGAVRGYNDFVGSLETRFMPQLRRFEEAGTKSGKELPEVKMIESAPRPVSRPDGAGG